MSTTGFQEYTIAKEHVVQSWRFNALANVSLPLVASVGAGVPNSTVQAQFILTQYCKIPKISISVSALDAITGNDYVNVVVGTGTYNQADVQATGTFTVAGTPTTTDNNVYVIGGHTATSAQTTGNTVTQQAAADVVVINGVPAIAALGVASNNAGVVTFTASAAGAAGNGITTTSSSGGGSTVTAGQASTAGGITAAAFTLPPTDNSYINGYPTAFASAGNALLQATTAGGDIPFTTTYFPGITASAGGVAVLGTAIPDAVFPPGTIITVRVTTVASTGSLTNLLVGLCTNCIDAKWQDDNAYPQPIYNTASTGW